MLSMLRYPCRENAGPEHCFSAVVYDARSSLRFASMHSTFMPEKRVGLVKADPNDHHGFTIATLALRDLAMA
jgi:hypothetical protein